MWCGILWAGRRSTWVVSGFLLPFSYPLPYCAGSSIICVYRDSLVVSRMASWVSCQYSDLSSIFPLFSTTESYTRCCRRTCRLEPSLLNSIYRTFESSQLSLHVAVTVTVSDLWFCNLFKSFKNWSILQLHLSQCPMSSMDILGFISSSHNLFTPTYLCMLAEIAGQLGISGI